MVKASCIWASQTFSWVCTPENNLWGHPHQHTTLLRESTPVTLIQRCNNVVCPVGYYTASSDTSTPIAHTPI